MNVRPSAVGTHRAGLSGAAAVPARRVASGTTGRTWLRRSVTGLPIAVVVLLASSMTGLLPVQVMRVGSDSMSPTIATGDLVLLDRSGGVERMDIVAVEHPDTGVLLVKRAVGVGGDRVSIEDGVLVVNGAGVCEPAIDPVRLDGVWFGPVTVPSGAIFVLGDDRASSIDSRAFGTVSAGAVRGLVEGRLWPAPGALPEDRC
jgi:signal peptidase I